jgi:glycosyltransferase involved in cell wall biosynthesis
MNGINKREISTRDAAPKVSVVMAAYNYERFVAGAIQSVLEQTFAGWELIIVDDGSTDNTPGVVRSFLTDARIRYHRQENQGQPTSENNGVAMARGEWIAFLDADDRWRSDKLEKQLALAVRNPDASVIYSERMLMDPDGNPLPTPALSQYRGRILKEVFRQNPNPFSSTIVKRTVINDAGGFNPKYRNANDYDLWLRIAVRDHQFDFVSEPLIWYRTGHSSLMSRGDVQLKTVLKIMDRFVASNPRRLADRWINLCYSETYSHLGKIYHDKRRDFRALYWCLRAVACQPTNRGAWKILLRLFLPEALVYGTRKLLAGDGQGSVR